MGTKKELKYTSEHEWIKVEGNTAYAGITDYAQEKLGDIVFVELPDLNTELKLGEAFCTIESVKTAAEIYMPAAGKIIKVNSMLEDEPEKINESPYESWIAAFTIKDMEEVDNLMNEDEYISFLRQEG